MKKAQAALEFLTTYGWMMMIMAIVGGALAYFGVFSPESNLPQQCNLGFDFACESYVILEDGTVRIKVNNKLGEPLTLNSLTCIYPDESSDTEPFGDTWGSGTSFDMYCNPSGAPPGGLTADERAQVTIRIEYQKASGGFVKTAEGQVNANVVGT